MRQRGSCCAPQQKKGHRACEAGNRAGHLEEGTRRSQQEGKGKHTHTPRGQAGAHAPGRQDWQPQLSWPHYQAKQPWGTGQSGGHGRRSHSHRTDLRASRSWFPSTCPEHSVSPRLLCPPPALSRSPFGPHCSLGRTGAWTLVLSGTGGQDPTTLLVPTWLCMNLRLIPSRVTCSKPPSPVFMSCTGNSPPSSGPAGQGRWSAPW